MRNVKITLFTLLLSLSSCYPWKNHFWDRKEAKYFSKKEMNWLKEWVGEENYKHLLISPYTIDSGSCIGLWVYSISRITSIAPMYPFLKFEDILYFHTRDSSLNKANVEYFIYEYQNLFTPAQQLEIRERYLEGKMTFPHFRLLNYNEKKNLFFLSFNPIVCNQSVHDSAFPYWYKILYAATFTYDL
jgi:hypothetical protein